MSRTYGQYCGLARSLEMVGERWGMLIVRDLILGPKRLTELREGLPRIAPSILATRLNELEEAGIVRRILLPHLDASVVYELTEYGADLEPIVMRLALWGAASLGEPDDGDVFTLDSAILSLHATFRPEQAAGVSVSYELRYGPGMTVHAIVDDGQLKVAEGAYADADLVIDVRGALRPLLSGSLPPSAALEKGRVGVTGDPGLLDVFVTLFQISAAPRPSGALAVR